MTVVVVRTADWHRPHRSLLLPLVIALIATVIAFVAVYCVERFGAHLFTGPPTPTNSVGYSERVLRLLTPHRGTTPCSLLRMDDDAFLQAFEAGTLPNATFHHRDHLRLTWLLLRRDGPELGAEHIVDGIRHFAAVHGAPDRFHVTLTRFWIRLVEHLMAAFPTIERFDDLLAVFPLVLDKAIVYRHYSATYLFSPMARQVWIAPDLLPLP